MRKLLPLVLVVFFFLGCATVPLTPEQKIDRAYGEVYMARSQLNDLVNSYKAYKVTLTLEKQLEITEMFLPLIERADFALDTWEDNLNSGLPWYAQEEVWLKVKREITTTMLQMGIIKVEE